MRKGSHHSEKTRMLLKQANLGQIPWNIGITHSNATRKKISEAAKRQFSDPHHKKTGWPKGQKRTLEQRLNDAETFKFHDHICCECSACKSMRGLGKGKNNGMFGKRHSKQSRAKMSLRQKGHIPWNKGLTKETDIRIARLSEAKIQQWKDPIFAKKMLHRRTPSVPERTFMNLTSQFRYVGNGQLMVDGKNPDFVGIEHDHILIEIWGEFFKKGRNPQDLVDFYAKRGYNCLVIWASELKQPDQVVLKVNQFVENL